ncbi:hypothetical protein [Novosphingobium kaempferiae]|uniref:hypothetical protein n=1 Tax=Novosphingobium kaempferiae TaxID=2896849 RepID=UPI001E4F949F|nr:hypothetical protein [Novosphingobium kaempferiae]
MSDSSRSNARGGGNPLDPIANAHDEIDYRAFAPVSRQLAASYACIAEMGLPASAVAVAMLGATVNFYECFGMSQELPSTLRALADTLEFTRPMS